MTLPAPRPVPVFEGVDERVFHGEVQPRGEPALLRGMALDWPLLEGSRRGPADVLAALRSHATDAPVEVFAAPKAGGGRFTFTDDALGFTFERRRTTIGGLLDALSRDGDEDLYAGGVNVPRVLPSLLAELPMPLLPEGTERLTSIWLGGRSRVPAHWDLPQNLAVCVHGRRRFTLFPASEVRNLYIGPIDRTIAGQPSSLVDVAEPDLDRFPRYAQAARHALVAELSPGDVLYVPSLWLHAVESEGPLGILVNFWWREAWRHLFDHFAFSGEAGAHLPEAARGVLGNSAPERRGWIAQILSRSLMQ